MCIIVFPPFDSFLYFNLFLYTRIPHLKVLQNVLLSLPFHPRKRLLMLHMMLLSLWLLRLGRELVGDVLRVFPRLSHEPVHQRKQTNGQRSR